MASEFLKSKIAKKNYFLLYAYAVFSDFQCLHGFLCFLPFNKTILMFRLQSTKSIFDIEEKDFRRQKNAGMSLEKKTSLAILR